MVIYAGKWGKEEILLGISVKKNRFSRMSVNTASIYGTNRWMNEKRWKESEGGERIKADDSMKFFKNNMMHKQEEAHSSDTISEWAIVCVYFFCFHLWWIKESFNVLSVVCSNIQHHYLLKFHLFIYFNFISQSLWYTIHSYEGEKKIIHFRCSFHSFVLSRAKRDFW